MEDFVLILTLVPIKNNGKACINDIIISIISWDQNQHRQLLEVFREVTAPQNFIFYFFSNG